MNTSESTVTEHNVSLMHTMTMPGQLDGFSGAGF